MMRVYAFLLLLALPFSGVAQGSDWPMFHKDGQHLGVSTDAGPGTRNVRWYYDVPGSPPIGSSPVVVDGRLFLTAGDSLRCLDASTGARIWVSSIGDASFSTPAVSANKIYVLAGPSDRRLYCFDARNGTRLWRTVSLGLEWRYYEYTGDKWPDSSPVVVNDSKVYVGARNGRVYCIRTSPQIPVMSTLDGTIVWSQLVTDPLGFVASSPAVSGNLLVICGSSSDGTGGVYCLDATSGVVTWYYTYLGWRWGCRASATIIDGEVYVGSDENLPDDGAVYRFSLNYSGQQNPTFRYNFPCAVESTPAVTADRVFIGTGQAARALTRSLHQVWEHADGETTYHYEARGAPAVSAPPGGPMLVYVGYWTDVARFYCIDAVTGHTVWCDTTSAEVRSSPAVADGRVYVGDDSGRLYCYGDSLVGGAGRADLAGETASRIRISPNPFRISTSLRYDHPVGPERPIFVFDAGGRLLRRLQTGADGAHLVRWDGEDAFGRKVPAGIYYIGDPSSGTRCAKVIRLESSSK